MSEMQQRRSLLSSSATTDSSSDGRDVASSIPPWVHVTNDNEPPLIPPGRAIPNSRHYKPPPAHYKPGRKWDHLRSAEAPLLSAPIAEEQQRWRSFMQSSPQQPTRGGRMVDAEWMQENMPDMMPGWHPDDETRVGNGGLSAEGLVYKGKWFISPERQERTMRLFWRLMLKNPFVPLVFRVTILAFSVGALAVAVSIFKNINRVNDDADPNNQCATRASTLMAISVGSIAVPYIGYVTWDEYMSKPLGLRSVGAKIILLLCDLYFICFASSNLSLALDALFDHRWACYDLRVQVIGNQHSTVTPTCPNNPSICSKQRALSGILTVSLIAWCTTFSISVLRVVEKLRPD